jgi:hypothetical protein
MRLALVNTPEIDQDKYYEAKAVSMTQVLLFRWFVSMKSNILPPHLLAKLIYDKYVEKLLAVIIELPAES